MSQFEQQVELQQLEKDLEIATLLGDASEVNKVKVQIAYLKDNMEDRRQYDRDRFSNRY